MPINFGQPTESQTVAARNTSSRDNQLALAKWLEGESVTDPVAGIKRLNNGLVEEHNGTSWQEKALAYAKLASPTFTGTPAAPTAGVDTNTTQLATTAYVVGQGYLKATVAASQYAALAGATFTGSVFVGGSDRVALLTSGDIYARRGDSTGVIFFGNQAGGSRYLYYDGSNYNLPLAQLYINGSLAWNAGNLTNLNQLSNGPGYITASALSPYAALASAPTFTGVVKGNNGGLGLGQISATTTAGTPTGGSDGDIVFVY